MAGPGHRPEGDKSVKVRFWGTRGSVPVPGATTLRYGGNTSCVEARTRGGTLLILDSGTGMRALGESLLREGAEAETGIHGHILLSHTHWDHIQGFPFFVPVFVPGNLFTIYAPANSDKSLENVLAGQMSYTYFPVELEHLESGIRFVDQPEETFYVADVKITTQHLNHSSLCLGYRLESGESSVVYCTDHEPFSARPRDATGQLVDPRDRRHLQFVAGADLLIHDAQYTDAEFQEKVGWGHSPLEHVVDLAVEGNVRRLALFHHDPTHDDSFIDAMVAQCRERIAALGATVEVFAAAEGLEVDVAEAPGFTLYGAKSRGTRQIDHQPRILIINEDPAASEMLKDSLVEDHYIIYTASSTQDAVEIAQDEVPDLVLWELAQPSPSARRFCRAVRSAPQLRDLPVLAVTPMPDAIKAASFRASFTDVIIKPFSTAEVRGPVREWLLRRHKANGPQRAAAPAKQPAS